MRFKIPKEEFPFMQANPDVGIVTLNITFKSQ